MSSELVSVYISFPIANSAGQFYLDDLEDELTTTALRMLVKDLLILFQACNEGVINVLGTSSLSDCARAVTVQEVTS